MERIFCQLGSEVGKRGKPKPWVYSICMPSFHPIFALVPTYLVFSSHTTLLSKLLSALRETEPQREAGRESDGENSWFLKQFSHYHFWWQLLHHTLFQKCVCIWSQWPSCFPRHQLELWLFLKCSVSSHPLSSCPAFFVVHSSSVLPVLVNLHIKKLLSFQLVFGKEANARKDVESTILMWSQIMIISSLNETAKIS